MKFIELSFLSHFVNEFKWVNSHGDETVFHSFPISNPVNIIVGANNSRKSRFFRHLFRQVSFLISNSPLSQQIEKIDTAVTTLNQCLKEDGFIRITASRTLSKFSPSQVNQNHDLEYLNDYIAKKFSGTQTIDLSYYQELLSRIKSYLSSDDKEKERIRTDIQKYISQITFIQKYPEIQKIVNSFRQYYRLDYSNQLDTQYVTYSCLEQLKKELLAFLDIRIETVTPHLNYIPTLRGSISLMSKDSTKISSSVYEDTIRNNYELDRALNLKIFTGLDLYDKVKKARNSPKEERLKFEAFESFLQKHFFYGKEIDIVALEGDNPIIQIYIGGDDREMYNIGDGIQAIILLMYPLFTAKPNEWFFIEEPELSMHPGLQTLFINTITENEYIKQKKLQIFITSHSNHLLNTLLQKPNQTSIFSFEKIATKQKDYTKIKQILGPENHVLELLGVTNSSVFMSNCTIWVEGISDRLYLKAFLLAYTKSTQSKPYLEDIHYSFFEYAGTNLIHYFFGESDIQESNNIKAHFLSNKIFVLADKDKAKEKKHKYYEKLNNKYFHYSHTEVLEIENLLSVSILKLIFKEKLGVSEEVIQKYRFKESSYANVGLGKYIGMKINKTPNVNRKMGTNTLSDYYKKMFSNFVFEKVKTNDITWTMIKENSHAEKLTKKLYKFIKTQNVNNSK